MVSAHSRDFEQLRMSQEELADLLPNEMMGLRSENQSLCSLSCFVSSCPRCIGSIFGEINDEKLSVTNES